MKVLVIGATGTIGGAVAEALAKKHDVIPASRNADVSVDIGEPASISAMYEEVGTVDAVVCCAVAVAVAALDELTDADFEFALRNKLMGHINVVRMGVDHVADGGSFTLTSGFFSQHPTPGVSTLAMVNGAIESFGRAAAMDMPRGIRVNVVSPSFIKETAEKMGLEGQISAARCAETYVALVEGNQNGTVIFPA